jgi:hypothetical protein
MSLIRSVNDDLKCGQFAPAGGGQFAPADVVKINRQGVVSLLWRGLFFLSGLSTMKKIIWFQYWNQKALRILKTTKMCSRMATIFGMVKTLLFM